MRMDTGILGYKNGQYANILVKWFFLWKYWEMEKSKIGRGIRG